MPLSFPASPTIGEQSTQNGRVYAWTGAAWELVSQIQAHTHSVNDLTATGTPSASTHLRGDGTWASVIQTTGGTAAAPALSFTGDPNTGIYNPSDDALAVATGGVQWLAVTSTGVLDLLSGQIKFPASANLSADANTLDGYEEGTWTPTFTALTTNPTVTYNTTGTFGRYVKIGRTVIVQCRVQLASASGGSGSLNISGLPFTTLASVGGQAAVVGFRSGWVTLWPTHAYFALNGTTVFLMANTTTANNFVTPANLSSASDIQVSGVYQTDA